MPEFRSVRESDFNDIVAGLRGAIAAASKPTARYLDPLACLQMMTQHENSYIVSNAYAVCFDIMPIDEEHGGGSMLVERLVLRVGKVPAPFSAVTDFLEYSAKRLGCKLVLVGSGLSNKDDALERLYRSHGYVTESRLMCKEIA